MYFDRGFAEIKIYYVYGMPSNEIRFSTSVLKSRHIEKSWNGQVLKSYSYTNGKVKRKSMKNSGLDNKSDIKREKGQDH